MHSICIISMVYVYACRLVPCDFPALPLQCSLKHAGALFLTGWNGIGVKLLALDGKWLTEDRKQHQILESNLEKTERVCGKKTFNLNLNQE